MAMQRYRCVTTTPLNLGGFDPPESISPGEIILWDGVGTLQREDGTKLSLKNPGGFRALVKAGWMVPDESEVQVHRPRPAGVQMHEAAPRGPGRAQVQLSQVDDEERDVGGIGAVRRNANTGAVPATRQATNVARTSPTLERTARGRRVIEEEPQEGVVIGTFKRPAQAPTVDLTKVNDRQFVERVSNANGADSIPIEKHPPQRRPPQGARVVESAEDLEDNGASPQFKDEGVRVSSTQSGVGGEETGRVVGKIGDRRPPAAAVAASKAVRAGENPPGMAIASELPEDVVEALRVWSEYGTTPDGEAAYSEPQLQSLVKTLLTKYDEALADISSLQELAAEAAPPAEEETPAEEEAELDLQWDLETHWKTRHSRVMSEFKDNRKALTKILALDNSVGVQKAAQQCLAQLGA